MVLVPLKPGVPILTMCVAAGFPGHSCFNFSGAVRPLSTFLPSVSNLGPCSLFSVSLSWSNAPARVSASLFLKSLPLAWPACPFPGQTSPRACILRPAHPSLPPANFLASAPGLTPSFSSSPHLVSALFPCHFLDDFAFVSHLLAG